MGGMHLNAFKYFPRFAGVLYFVNLQNCIRGSQDILKDSKYILGMKHSRSRYILDLDISVNIISNFII